MPVILLTNRYSDEVLDAVAPLVPTGFTFRSLKTLSQEALVEAAAEADYFLASGRLRIDADVIAAAPRLRMVQRTGVGTDGLDTAALLARDIPAYVNRGVNARSVAEHTVMLLLATMRRLPAVHERTVQGGWAKNETGLSMRSLHGKAVGLLGLGNIGRIVARMLAPFGVDLRYHKPQRLSPAEEQDLNVRYQERDELLRNVDALCILCPLNAETRGMIDGQALSVMKRGAYLVNTARGGIVDEAALVAALESGHLAGVATDVYAQEPPAVDAAIRSAKNVILTPHVAGLTLEAFLTMIASALKNIERFHAGDMESLAPNRLV
ncbi:MAG: 2-hydroxyacid dehydrogenase [Flavobacteriales bacterium]|nr:2-hydroxyacid dehydrogenase [Flavobacteriales bacterium]